MWKLRFHEKGSFRKAEAMVIIMHIPLQPIEDSAVLSFADACTEERGAEPGYDKTRWLYLPCRYLDYRYILGTRGTRPLICIGINPSTAEPGALDNTLKSVERIAHANGFDSFIMFNVYPQRATNPDDMDTVRSETLHRENMEAFRYILSSCGSDTRPAVWAAWGTVIEKRDYLVPTVRDMISVGKAYGAAWFSVGARTKKGHPHHPLYLKKDAQLEAFDIDAYTEALLRS